MHQKYLRHLLAPLVLMAMTLFSCTADSTKKHLISYSLPYEGSTKDALEDATCYFIRGISAQISKMKGKSNYYLLSMHIPDAIISFGGLATTQMNSMNSLIFFNQWSEEIFGPGGLIVFDSSSKNVPQNLFVNVLVSSSKYNVDEHSATFILIPQEPMSEFFLSSTLNSCLLVIQSTQSF